MKLSIIIPVYKVERTLNRCIESVLRQKFRDYQLILVDDGSPDRCPDLCDEWMKKDSRIQVIHKKNGGLSDARNAGLRKAKGEYVTFIDSDDYLADDTLRPLMDLLAIHHDYDILEYSVYEHYGWAKHMNVLRLENREYTDMRRYWYDQKAYCHTYAWNKIYRRDLFRNVKFPEGRKFEDAFTLPRLLRNCQTVATTSQGFYYYCHNTEGITMQADGNDMKDLLDAHLSILRNHRELHPVTHDYYLQVLNIALDYYDLTGQVPVDFPMPKQLDMADDSGRKPFKTRMLQTTGLRQLCRLHKLYKKLTRAGR